MNIKSKADAVIKANDLSVTKTKNILKEFQDYFSIAEEWEKKAKAIVVTDASQVADMKLARIGRLALKEKRVTIEKRRKALKSSLLREGKAIDGIANVLKAIIMPIEEHLDKQEHFVEKQEEAKQALIAAEVEKRMNEERLTKEKEEHEKNAKLETENKKLREEQAELNRIAAKKEAQVKTLLAEEATARLKAQRETNKAKCIAEKKEKELKAEIASLITCPKCGHKFTKEDPF